MMTYFRHSAILLLAIIIFSQPAIADIFTLPKQSRPSYNDVHPAQRLYDYKYKQHNGLSTYKIRETPDSRGEMLSVDEAKARLINKHFYSVSIPIRINQKADDITLALPLDDED